MASRYRHPEFRLVEREDSVHNCDGCALQEDIMCTELICHAEVLPDEHSLRYSKKSLIWVRKDGQE